MKACSTRYLPLISPTNKNIKKQKEELKLRKVINHLTVWSGLLIALVVVLTGSAIGQSGSNQTSGRRDGMRFVPNVQSQFLNVTEYADPLG